MTKHYDQKTIGEAIEILEKVPKYYTIKFCDYLYPDISFHSYRGYYEDVAFAVVGEETSVGEWLGLLKDKVGGNIYGWKGGEYVVKKDTALWVADHSTCGPFVKDFLVNNEEEEVIIILGKE